MKKGGSKAANAGFTIVETMIVLAVTGSMLLIAITFVSGRQNRTAFQVSINDLKQQLEQIINETSSGRYTNNGNFTCVGSGTLVKFTPPPMGGQAQGTNVGCIFLGNIIQFGIGTGTDASKLGILPIVGKQYDSAGKAVQLVDVAKPRAVYALGGESVPTDTVDFRTMQYGLVAATGTAPGCTLSSMCYIVGGVPRTTGTIAIIAGDSAGRLATQDGADLKPGAQRFTLYGVNGSAPTQNMATVAQKVGNYVDTLGLPVPQGLQRASKAIVCVASGTTAQSGLFTIDSDLHVTLKIYGNTTCS